MTDSVARLARRVAIDPFFFGFALAVYAAAEGLDETGLAAALGCPPEQLAHVRLCRAPRADSGGFREDVDRIAEAFGLTREAVATVARRGQVVAAMRVAAGEVPDGAGFLIAARDRTP